MVKDSPSLEDWITVVHDIYMIEKLTFILRQEEEQCLSLGDPGSTMYYHLEQILPLSTC